jgi:hypothetical protein
MWIGFIWLRIGPGGGVLQSKALLGSVKGGEFFEQLSNCWLVRKESAPWSWLIFYMFVEQYDR